MDGNADGPAGEKSNKTKDSGPLSASTKLQSAFIKGANKWEELVSQTAKSTVYTGVAEEWLTARTEPLIEPGQTWSTEDESRLQAQWRDSPLRSQIEKETSETVSDLHKVWKVFGQYFRCVPTDAFGNGLTGSTEYRLCIDLSYQRKIKDLELLQYSPL